VTASPYDEPLSALRENTENLATWIAIWEARQEPDAFARRCARTPWTPSTVRCATCT
jgi:hypothetical protein